MELTGRAGTADIRDGSESRSPTDKNAAFLSSGIRPSACTARGIGENRVSNDSLSRILSGDVLESH